MINDMNINFDALLKQGFGVIDVRYKDYEIVTEGFKYVIILVDHDRGDFYADMIKNYLGHELKANNILETWLAILKHKLKMSAMLKRDISIKVATLDFLESKV